MQPIITAQHVSYSYGSHTPVLTDVSFEVYENDFVGLIGPNGGGKTTLLKIILGLLEPTAGEVRIFGKDPVAARSLVGYVPQYSKIDLDYPISALEVVLSGFWGINRSAHDIQQRRRRRQKRHFVT
jgi:zinc transport system ATP-binding protein